MVNLVSRRSSLILAAASLTPLGELKRWKQIAEHALQITCSGELRGCYLDGHRFTRMRFDT